MHLDITPEELDILKAALADHLRSRAKTLRYSATEWSKDHLIREFAKLKTLADKLEAARG